MLDESQVEELITVVSTFDRPTLTKQFKAYRGNFPIDFSVEFLAHTPIDRLRHIFVAMCLQNQKLPLAA